MAYTTLLSTIPSLAAIFALISLFSPLLGNDSGLLNKARAFILSNLAAGSGEQVISHIEAFLANLDMTKIGLSGLAGLMLSLILLLRQIELALNRIWLVQKERNVVTRFVYFWTFLTLGTFLLVLTFGVLAGTQIQSIINLGEIVDVEQGFLAKLIPWAATGVFFFLLYKIVPNTFVSTKQALTGAIPALILFLLAGKLYAGFTAKFASYQAVYGALAAVPLFLTWLYILWLIILFGALLSWRAQQGFDLPDDDESPQELSPLEKLRNHQIQSITPYLVMLTILHRHNSGDGKGISGAEISNALNIPPHWIQDAVDFLLDRNLVVLAQNNDINTLGNANVSRIYPARPATQIASAEFVLGMTQDARQWLVTWKHELAINLQKILEEFWLTLPTSQQKTNLAAVLDKLQLESGRS